MTPIHQLSGMELHRLIRTRDITAADATEVFLERIARFGDVLGAFVTVSAESARDQASQADRYLAKNPSVPPLAGVPTAVKDLVEMKGTRTTFGSRARMDHVSEFDADVVKLVRDTAMPILGKTNTAEYGFASYTEPDVAPPARSPWDPRMSAGGSSGGSAAAVAAGLVPLAHGSDSGGSLRIPASMCGVIGFKPTRGRISNGPVGTERFGLASHGVLSRTSIDAAALLDRLCVRLPGDLHRLPQLPCGGFIEAVKAKPRPMRVEVWTTSPLSGAQPDTECIDAVNATAAALKELGHEVTWAEPPLLSDLIPTFLTLWTVSAASIDVPEGREDQLQSLLRALRDQGRKVSGIEVGRAIDTMDNTLRRLLPQIQTWDVLVTPTLAAPGCEVGALRDDSDPWGSFMQQAAFAPYTSIWNCTGNPAVSLPVHWTADGLPVGVQLVGRMSDDSRLLSIVSQLEKVFRWSDRFPDEKLLSSLPIPEGPAAQWT